MSKKMYTRMSRAVFLEMIVGAQPADERTIGDLIANGTKAERVLAKRALMLACMAREDVSMIATLIKDENWSELIFWELPSGTIAVELVRLEAQKQIVRDEAKARFVAEKERQWRDMMFCLLAEMFGKGD